MKQTEFDIRGDGCLTVTLRGRFDAATTVAAWRAVKESIDGGEPSKIVLEAAEIEYLDGAGLALLVEIEKRAPGTLEIHNLREDLRALLELFDPDKVCADLQSQQPTDLVEEVGSHGYRWFREMADLVIFIGHMATLAGRALIHPSRVRWRDLFLIVEKVGVNAVPIVSLIGFLMGLVMAFQSAVPMQQFGVEIYVADLVGISMIKELGPLMAAIVMAGRSSSAFAAELGTMKVNEEVAALTTMGLDPVRFLAFTRTLAAVIVAPFLGLFCSIAGLIGGAIVILSFGYPLVTYVEHVRDAADLSDYLAGLSKSVVFGLLVAGVGCVRGLQTGSGPTAVGDSTTRAVVNGILLIALADAVFAVLFYALGV